MTLIRTKLPSDLRGVDYQSDEEIIHTVTTLCEQWKSARSELETFWKICWATYFGTSEANKYLRQQYLNQTVGDVNKDWRHNISQAKAYDIVETAIPYFMSASFPNEDWFDIVPEIPLPDDGNINIFLRAIKEFIRNKLDNANFKTVWNTFLRQLCIIGTSCISLPWRLETKETKTRVVVRGYNSDEDTLEEIEVEKIIKNCPDMVVEDMMDIFLDPDADNPNEANMIRRFTLRRAELVRLVEDGVYPKIKVSEIKDIRGRKSDTHYVKSEMDTFYGLDTYGNSIHDTLEVWEYWGSLELCNQELYDVIVTWCDGKLLRVETNPYEGGRPFVFGQYTPIPKSPYGWGMLQPVLGNIHELDIISNCRLDGLEVTLQPTFLVQNDGTVDPNDVYVEPGRVIPVANTDGIKPLITDTSQAGISIQEEQLREQLIERRVGTSSFVGTAPGRSGDRVTAKEVEATQSAGGNRLSGVYENIERQALLPLLGLTYEYARQFQSEDELISVPGDNSKEFVYVTIGMYQLAYPMKLKPVGAKHITDKEYELRQFMDWLAAINSTPQLPAFINWEAVALELTRKFISNSPDRFIVTAEQQQAMQPQQPQTPEQIGQQIGGQELANAVQTQMMADGGQSMMSGINQTMPQAPVFSTEQELLDAGQPTTA